MTSELHALPALQTFRHIFLSSIQECGNRRGKLRSGADDRKDGQHDVSGEPHLRLYYANNKHLLKCSGGAELAADMHWKLVTREQLRRAVRVRLRGKPFISRCHYHKGGTCARVHCGCIHVPLVKRTSCEVRSTRLVWHRMHLLRLL